MYTADDARIRNLPRNARATSLLTACGHAVREAKASIGAAPPGGIHGDAFVGRYHDDEARDVWEREDMDVEEVTVHRCPLPEWIELALKPGGGSGGSVSTTTAATDNNNVPSIEDLKIGQGDGYTWNQNDDEVELRFPMDGIDAIKARDVKIEFKMKSLKVVVFGKTLLDATLGGDVDTEDSTFTIEDGNSGKELCVTLGKKESYTWRTVATPRDR